ncbi:MAG: DUF559 domain-containing protein [Deltaproteobacteria bacterium]|nr:DUF559 domain-containing protein [Deltaproteobacteria bacterium]
MSLKIYCAGPVGPEHWRATIVKPALLQISAQEIATMLATEEDFHWPIRLGAIFRRFDYVGPYFIDPTLSEAADDYMLISAIEEADVIFAYLPTKAENTRWGIELGYAAALQKRIWVSTPSADERHSTLSGSLLVNLSTKVTLEASDPATALWTFLQQEGAFCQSPLELLFWKQLRRLDAGWVTQYPVKPYALDFALPACKLAIELDGHEFHKTKEQRTHDARKDRFLSKRGWTVLRFTGTEVYSDTKRCVAEVQDLMQRVKNSPDPAPLRLLPS